MTAPLEVVLTHPVEIDGVVHTSLTLQSKLTGMRRTRGDAVSRLARHFGVSRDVIGELDLADIERLSDAVANHR